MTSRTFYWWARPAKRHRGSRHQWLDPHGRSARSGPCLRDSVWVSKSMSEPAEVAVAVVTAIQSGDVAGLRQLLAEHPDAASAQLGGRYKSRTPLHVVADWPGYFPNGPEVVRLLVDA